MKRSEMLVKLQRYYGFKHVMVEERYISPNEFMDKVLELVEELGMLPPRTGRGFNMVNRWDEELMDISDNEETIGDEK